MSIYFDANLNSYWNNDLLSRYGASGASSSDSSSFRDAIIADLRATGALPPASYDDLSSNQSQTTSADTSATTTTTASAGSTTTSDATSSGSTDATTASGETQETTETEEYPTRSNYYDFTTDTWQSNHAEFTELFNVHPGLSAFLGDNATYGSLFVNDGEVGVAIALNAYLANQASESSESTVSATA